MILEQNLKKENYDKLRELEEENLLIMEGLKQEYESQY